METLDLEEAAEFLRMNAESLRRRAKRGDIPSRKTGKKWLFIKKHLADWVSGRYPEPKEPLKIITGKKAKTCQSTSAKRRGGSRSPTQTATQYEKLLGLK